MGIKTGDALAEREVNRGRVGAVVERTLEDVHRDGRVGRVDGDAVGASAAGVAGVVGVARAHRDRASSGAL